MEAVRAPTGITSLHRLGQHAEGLGGGYWPGNPIFAGHSDILFIALPEGENNTDPGRGHPSPPGRTRNRRLVSDRARRYSQTRHSRAAPHRHLESPSGGRAFLARLHAALRDAVLGLLKALLVSRKIAPRRRFPGTGSGVLSSCSATPGWKSRSGCRISVPAPIFLRKYLYPKHFPLA
jgi:hypothetical protein